MSIKPDKYQQAIIDSNEKDIIILAGAGSGKTFTMLQKIHKLVSIDNIDPEHILILTFTRAAALEMRHRYITNNKAQYHNVPDFNTFHAFCYKLLLEQKMVTNALGYKIPPTILEDSRETTLIDKAKAISGCKLSTKKLKDIDSLSFKERLSCEAYLAALDRLYKKENVISFDKLNKTVCKLFVSNDSSILPIKQKYKYIFVDEFQDTDMYQFEFVMSMKNSNRILCGDALQNIYQFRGCTNEPLKQLIESEDWIKYKLPKNYRSTNNICEYVNTISDSFISKDYRIELVTDKSNGSEIVTNVLNVNTYSQYDIFPSEYIDHIEQYINTYEGNFAVLCRTNREVDDVIKKLSERNISCSSIHNTDIYINMLKSSISDEYMEEYLESLIPTEQYTKYLEYKTSGTVDIKEYDCVQSTLTQIYMLRNILETNEEVENILISMSQIFDIDLTTDSTEKLTKDGIIPYVINKIQNTNIQIYVGTIHSVKGKEYDNVIVLNCDNPNFFKLNSEENQNLFYVACTRAKNNLIICKN